MTTAATQTVAWPLSLVTLADWDALPEDELHHVECSEGVLIVTPKPSPRHQSIGANLVHHLNRALRPALRAVPDVDVLLETEPLTVRAPDVVVVPDEVYRQNPPRFSAADVLLAVEVLSVGTRRQDRVTKMAEYAEAGIPDYWIVDLEGQAVVTAYRSRAGGYEFVRAFDDGIDTTLHGLPVRFPLSAVLD